MPADREVTPAPEEEQQQQGNEQEQRNEPPRDEQAEEEAEGRAPSRLVPRVPPWGSRSSYYVFATNWSGTHLMLECTRSMLVSELRAMIAGRMRVPAELLHTILLTYAGKQLDDAHTLDDYRVYRESTVCFIQRLRGC
jgi:hypothetical protein